MSQKIDYDHYYAYAEILEILSFTHISLVHKIPPKLINLFKTYALSTYEYHLNKDLPIEEQDISNQTASLLTLISLNYWCESEEEKNEINALLAENEKIANRELKEKYNPNNIFQPNQEKNHYQSQKNISSSPEDVSNLPIDYEKLPWYKKIHISLNNLFSKIKKKNK